MERVVEMQKKPAAKRPSSHREWASEIPAPLHPMLALQQQAGNRAMQQLLRSGAIRAKLEVSQPGDPEEQEADNVADRIMRSHAGAGAVASSCGSSEDDESCGCPGSGNATVSRSASAGTARMPSTPSARGVMDTIRRSHSHPLDAHTRAFFEPRFGRDFSGVRVHTGEAAASSARAIRARAYAAGEHLVFDSGQYAPHSEQGQKLLAHELTHVVQHAEGSATVHRDLPPELNITMTPDYAHGLTDADLSGQIATLRGHLDEIAENDPERDAVQANLNTLVAEQRTRTGGASGLQAVGEMPRPAGLPLDQGFALHDAPAELQALAAQIPEGQVVNVVMAPPAAQNTQQGRGAESNATQPSRLTTPLGAAALSSTMSANAQLVRQGFAAAGENSIVIVAVPRWGTPGAMIPEAPAAWGHTAVGVRIGGQIRTVEGLSPNSMLDVVRNYSGVRSGAMAVPSQISNDMSLLTNTGAVTLEYPVTLDTALNFSRGLPPTGPVGTGGPGYTAVPAEFGNPCQGQNCVYWAANQAEQALGGRIGPAGGTPIVDVPQVGQGGQGQLVRFIRNVSQGTEEAAPVENAIGSAVGGAMPTGLKILKIGGRVMIVVSIAMIPIETYLAPPEQRERTAVGATGGFIGGFAAGAAAGIFCGPGAPVCSIVLGLGGGLAGSVGGRALAEGAYDLAEDVGRLTPAQWIDTSTLMFGTQEARQANCELKEIEGVYDPLCEL